MMLCPGQDEHGNRFRFLFPHFYSLSSSTIINHDNSNYYGSLACLLSARYVMRTFEPLLMTY